MDVKDINRVAQFDIQLLPINLQASSHLETEAFSFKQVFFMCILNAVRN